MAKIILLSLIIENLRPMNIPIKKDQTSNDDSCRTDLKLSLFKFFSKRFEQLIVIRSISDR